MRSLQLLFTLALLAMAARADPLSFAPVNVPGTYETVANGINNQGQVVGWDVQDGTITNSPQHGFVDTGKTFRMIDDPNAVFMTRAEGINNRGEVAGVYWDALGNAHGFLDVKGIITTIDDPNGTYTVALGINDSEQMVGWYANHGFLYSDGTFTTIDVPGAISTIAIGINNRAQIVGIYQDGSGIHGFLESMGIFITIEDPNAPDRTYAWGINNLGQVVGHYIDVNGNAHGFLENYGTFTTIDNPSLGLNLNASTGTYGTGTYATGINNRDQIAGYYIDHDGLARSFVTSIVPEPSALVLLATVVCLGTLKIARRRRSI